ncbi:hypothetical protein LJ707_03305 [Mucilaginibacter sp. UR6-1]|uniref:hypothetical protein n=1 Tax=Mucilaginibacter sp. UR6-1 TaxID=1435643 RepID=UPI001E3FFC59|nr:hypothetical protein [Mucilaginibacter sp. UR6-1]MCC8407941.1 hypothetical protein [Mucilaginibacter sp. UR6-1]
MSWQSRRHLKAISSGLMAFVFLSLINYIFDIIINPSYSLQNPEYIGAYVIYYLMLRNWLVLGLILIYYLFTRNTQTLINKFFSVCVVLFIAAISGKYFGKDDWNFSIHTDDWKNIITYPLAALATWGFYEWLMRSEKLIPGNNA